MGLTLITSYAKWATSVSPEDLEHQNGALVIVPSSAVSRCSGGSQGTKRPLTNAHLKSREIWCQSSRDLVATLHKLSPNILRYFVGFVRKSDFSIAALGNSKN